MENTGRPALVKALGMWDAAALVVGSMIGSGIFLAPSYMAGYIQTPGLILLLWVIGGVLTVCGALSYGELSAAMPAAGGQYVFLREAYSRIWGFLYGWTLFVVIQTGFIAAVAVAFAKYLGVFIPWISEDNFIAGGFSTAKLIGIMSIVVLTFINCFGVKLGAVVQNIFTALKVIAILVLIAASLLSPQGSTTNLSPLMTPVIPEAAKLGLFAALAVAMSKALFAYDAWNTVTFTAEEVKKPERNLPAALLLGTAAVMVIYTLASLSYFYIVPVGEAASIKDNRIAAEVAMRVFGPAGLYFISAAILISTFGCNNGLILGGPRVFYAMSKDGLFFKAAAAINERYKTPVNSLVFQGIWASVLVLSGTYNDLLTYTAFASLLFNAMTVAGVYILRRRRPDLERPFKTWGYPAIPALYILIAVFFLVFIVQGDPRNSGLGLVVIAAGVPVYWFWGRRKAAAGRP